MAITNKEELDKKILEQDGEIAALKAKAEESDKLHEEMEKVKAEAKDMRDKLAEVASKNWTEKYSTQNTKEETLFNFGNYIKGVARKDKDLLNKYGSNGSRLTADQANAWGKGDYIMQKTDLGTPIYSDAATGSYVVPVEYAAEIMYVAKQSSQLMGQVREIPMNAVTKYVPLGDTMPSVSWSALQSSAKSETNPTFSRATLTSYTGAMWTAVSDELLEDSLVPLAAYFRDTFGEAFGYEFDYQVCQGSSPFTGLTGGAGNSFVMGDGQTSFQDVKFDDLYDTISELTTVNKRMNGKWIFHCTVFDILRKVKDANGNYLYQQPAGTQPGTLCGYPFIISDGMVSTSSDAVSTAFAIFGNPKYYLWGNRTGIEFKVFDQTTYAAEYDEIIFRGRVRWAFTTGISSAFVTLKTAAS